MARDYDVRGGETFGDEEKLLLDGRRRQEHDGWAGKIFCLAAAAPVDLVTVPRLMDG